MSLRTPLLTGVVVHWHNEELLAELTAAWPRDPRFELVVVDNGSRDPNTLSLGPARLLQPGRNLGFAGGANAGIAVAGAPIVLLLNPDAVPEDGALDRLLEGFAAWPDVAGLAPRLIGPGGESQAAWQLRSLPSAWECLLHALPFGGQPRPLAEPEAGTPVEQPAAAALAFRREALESVGGLDAGFHPAWFEDVDLARRLRTAGAVLRYWPAACFRHHLGSTVQRLGYGPFLRIYYRNLTRYLEKHHGRGWAAAARVLVILGALLRLLLLPLRRPDRAASRGAAFRGLIGVMSGALRGWRPHPPDPPLPSPSLPPGEGGKLAADRRSEEERVAAPLSRSGGRAMGEGMGVRPAVAVCIVTHNSAPDLPGCLEAVARLEHRPLEIVVVDCASTDGSLEAARRSAPAASAGIPFQAVGLAENAGFAGGMNAAFRLTTAPFVLTLNADARPAPDYVSRLLARAEAEPDLRAGAVTGRLVRPEEAAGVRRLDACGMRLISTWRHLDRGSGEEDRGQLATPERVFGATGAASLFRRAALDDAAVEGEIFDSRFHSFREDAELCFRLRERGWEILYEPAAVTEHRRFNLPERRSAMPPMVNYHSLKNRYLLRLYHQTGGNLLRTFAPTFLRDAAALGYVLLRERSSLAAYAWLWRHRAEILRRRRIIQGRRTVPSAAIDRWFFTSGEPL